MIAAVRVAAARVTSPAAAAMPRLRPSSVPTAWRTSGWQQSAGLSMLTRRAARRGGWRRGGGGGGGGEGDPMLLLYGLIGANVGVFVLWRTSDPVFMQKHFTLSSWSLTSRPHTLLTHMFSHYDGFHLLANMVTLYFFGSTLAPLLGAVRFATLYFTGGLVSAGTHRELSLLRVDGFVCRLPFDCGACCVFFFFFCSGCWAPHAYSWRQRRR